MMSVKHLISQKWQQLAPREQKVLMLAIPLALMLSLYLALRGLLGWQEKLQQQVDSRQATLAEMQSLVTAIENAGGGKPESPEKLIVQSGNKLALWDDEPGYQPDYGRATIDNRSFASVVHWLNQLEQQGVSTTNLQLARSESGKVSGDVHFAGNER